MKLKRGDKVQIIAGKDRGKTGTIVKAFPKLNQILIDGVNMHKKHIKPRKAGQKGQLVDQAFPIDVSNAKKI